MHEECLICKAPLVYLNEDEPMQCEICHRRENSKTRCVNGHYVCNECHTKGMDTILALCLSEDSKNPVAILEKMMSLPFCHMHGPEHHVMVGAALLTAYKNAGGDIELESALNMNLTAGANELWSVTQENGRFTVTARRLGHGIGMSQRGAMYMAQLG